MNEVTTRKLAQDFESLRDVFKPVVNSLQSILDLIEAPPAGRPHAPTSNPNKVW